MRTTEAADYVAAMMTEALQGLAVVVRDPEDATGHILAGTPTVVIAPPSVQSDDRAAIEMRFETPIIGAPVNDREAAWAAIDTIMTVLRGLIEFERATPIQWQGAQTTTAPAYLLTHTLTLITEGN